MNQSRHDYYFHFWIYHYSVQIVNETGKLMPNSFTSMFPSHGSCQQDDTCNKTAKTTSHYKISHAGRCHNISSHSSLSPRERQFP